MSFIGFLAGDLCPFMDCFLELGSLFRCKNRSSCTWVLSKRGAAAALCPGGAAGVCLPQTMTEAHILPQVTQFDSFPSP